MKVTMVLAESAVVRNTFLDLTGAGWFRNKGTLQVGEVGLILEIPWSDADQPHRIRIWLVRRIPDNGKLIDSPPVWDLSRDFVPPSDAIFPGGPVVGVMACPMPARRLEANSFYTVRVAIDGEADDAWAQDFYTVEE